ncbi:VapE domain-containing protein [uncultured Bacteroides sp.]|uniref:VapE domain-containing protein n=1 Tax=uncultured Bacteroides sp. TaxID=162156 RepID=UPI002AA61A5E|nr:VapE domain-containing protein [uncultured Bacteroides sp.]
MAKRELIKTTTGNKASGKVHAVKEWLDLNYEIKLNVFDPSKSYIKSKVKEYNSSIRENDIYLHAIDDGLSCSKSLLKTILSSPNQMTPYNPILEYFDSLKKKWKGESMINLYCSYMTAHDFRDKGNDFYQNRMKYLVKKWLVAVVACAYGKRQNDVALGFINAQGGIGKTSLIGNIIPECLEEYYIISDKDERIFKMTDCFATKLIINFDEFVGLNKGSENAFKNNMSRTHLDMKLPGESFTTKVQRIASCAFSSNKTQEQGGFLFNGDSGFLRRIAAIEIDEIKDYRKILDVDQLWSEAVTLFEGDYDYVFNKEDYSDFNSYNSRYVIETTAYKLVKEWYKKPTEDEETIFKMPMDIVRDMKAARKITSSMSRIDDITIGQALRALGYERIGKKLPGMGTRYGYKVVQLY